MRTRERRRKMNVTNGKPNDVAAETVNDIEAMTDVALVVVGDKLVVIGDRRDLCRVMSSMGGATPGELALITGTKEVYLRDWLSTQAARGFIVYEESSGRFGSATGLPAVHATEASAARVRRRSAPFLRRRYG
jgi:hypothetical protein